MGLYEIVSTLPYSKKSPETVRKAFANADTRKGSKVHDIPHDCPTGGVSHRHLHHLCAHRYRREELNGIRVHVLIPAIHHDARLLRAVHAPADAIAASEAIRAPANPTLYVHRLLHHPLPALLRQSGDDVPLCALCTHGRGLCRRHRSHHIIPPWLLCHRADYLTSIFHIPHPRKPQYAILDRNSSCPGTLGFSAVLQCRLVPNRELRASLPWLCPSWRMDMQGQCHSMVLNAHHPRHRDSHQPTLAAQARLCRTVTRRESDKGKHETELQVPQRMGSNRRVPPS